jgi:ABC-type branched-subunit amino acid transport system substrate-binding protein
MARGARDEVGVRAQPLRRPAALLVAAALAAGLAGCESEGITGGGAVLSDTLTVYSLLPDPKAPVAADIVDGEKLALAQAGGRAGRYTINFVSLAEGADGAPGPVAEATRDAISDTQVIAVIDALDSAGARTSAPLFNEAGILQVALGAGYPGLTRRARPDEPARYQPSARTTFARVVGDDDQQARAIVTAAQGAGGGSVGAERAAAPGRGWSIAIESEGGEDPAALARAVDRVAQEAGARVVGDPRRADALVYAGGDPVNAAGVADGWAREAPRARIVLPDEVVRAGVADRLSAAARRRAALVSSAPISGGSAEQRAFEATFRREFGRTPGPYAAVGYEAMRSVLGALVRAGNGANKRQRVIDAFLTAPERPSLLGPLKVDGRGVRVAPLFTIERR